MAQLAKKGNSQPSASRWGRILLIFAVGVALGGVGGTTWTREFSYPRMHTVVGVVQGLDSAGSSFGFTPDEGTPIAYSVGGAEGAQYLSEGARVTLAFVDVSKDEHLLAEVSPA